MACPLCERRKARRRCPAVNQTICSNCCGTKRLVEIACPPDCGYLASARQHPPAVVQRRQARDMEFLWPVVQGLSEQQSHLFILLQLVVRKHQADVIPALIDADVADAAASMAATLETADRGIIYEHHATSGQAQRLATALKVTLDKLIRDAPSSAQRRAAAVLRRLEQAAHTADAELGEGPRSYLDLVDRLPGDPTDGALVGGPTGPDAAADDGAADSPRLIVP